MNTKTARNLITAVLCTSLIVTGQSIEISGSLQSMDGTPLKGTIDIIEEGPELTVTSHLIDESGIFRVVANTLHGVVVHASAENHPPDERYIQPRSGNNVNFDFVLPLAQNLTGKIVDRHGTGVAGATVHVRYHEPDRPVRRSAFHDFHSTDGAGYFMLSDVGMNVPFFVDVHASGYRPVSSQRMIRSVGETKVDDIVLDAEGGTVLVQVLDRSGNSVDGAEVFLLADPAGYRPEEHGSLLHGRAFHQRAFTSRFGNALFVGVPPGRIRIHVMSPKGEAKLETYVEDKQRLEISLDIL